LLDALREGRELHGLRVIALGRHREQLHLLAEAENNASLSRGMQGMSIRIAKSINRVIGAKGNIFADHFEAFVLRSARQVREARGPIRWEQPEGAVSRARLRVLH
jgi:putative transposase